MSEVLKTLEVERLVNLVSGFGWKKVSETTKDDEIVITVSKKVLSATEAVGSGTPQ